MSEALKDYMSNLIFDKLADVKDLTALEGRVAREYRISQDYEKIAQIIGQYQVKYEK